jgi:HMG box factor, other
MVPVMISPPKASQIRQHGDVFGGDPHAQYKPMPATPMTPDPKRRRFNGSGINVPGRGEIAESPGPYTPRKMSLPRPEAVHHPHALVRSPPSRNTYQQQRYPSAQASPPSKHDPSLVLPPLRIHGPSREQRGGLAAMIMSLPVLTKVKMLALAAPQLATPGPASPPFEVRGAILAVEGLDSEKVRLMTEYLTEELGKSEKFSVKVFTGPPIPKHSKEDLESIDFDELRGPFEYFLETIGKWHKISRDMCRYITTKPGKNNRLSSAATETEDALMTDASQQAEKRVGESTKVAEPEALSPVSPRTLLPTTAGLSLKSPTWRASPDAASLNASVPIAIVPRYQLTTVDVAAVSMAITDSYSPNDHWRWLASLWRGCVGPDITIVLRGPGEGAEGSGENWDSVATGVEVRLQGERTVVVRMGRAGEIDEKALRRVGFEVEEYLRR